MSVSLFLTTEFKVIKYRVTEQGGENFDRRFRGLDWQFSFESDFG